MRTEIIRKSARSNTNCYTSQDFAQIQKQQMLGQLYQQVSSYYRDKIDSKEFVLGFGYYDENGVEYAHVGIYDNSTGEQVL